MARISNYLGKVICADALDLLRTMPSKSVDAFVADPMFGTAQNFRYEWGLDPARGDPVKHWHYHQPLYEECRRILKPGGTLAWAQGFKFLPYFDGWFGPHRVWSPICTAHGLNMIPNAWIVQTKEQQPIHHPNNMLVRVDGKVIRSLRESHPCPKSVEEMAFMIQSLTQEGQVIGDCFCGVGSGLVAAHSLGREWFGCDRSHKYCQITRKRLAGREIPRTNGEPIVRRTQNGGAK